MTGRKKGGAGRQNRERNGNVLLVKHRDETSMYKFFRSLHSSQESFIAGAIGRIERFRSSISS